MTKTMEEKVALVTGSAMGIGLACAEAFAKAGYITVLADIREPGRTSREISSRRTEGRSISVRRIKHASRKRDDRLDRSYLRKTGCGS